MNYRTPLARARGLGSAGEGAHHWRIQRISAIALLPLSLWFALSLGSLDSLDFDVVTAWLSKPWVPALLSLFFATAYYHAMLGLQVVIEDYVHGELVRNTLLIGVKLLAALMAVSTIISILRVAL
ncbi:MAG: succinate dehydrogenase membrane anchor subunit [marine bacterium B5-7]|nr:MAG: succinate dehydrogenase membrane anchor subunit [marine bacterium B5-7]